ncbi:MAG: hypothetical protein ACREXR_06545 [Gammaproteobacteria bacterium]
MDTLLSLPKALADAALGLLKIKSDDRTRQRLADLLCTIADCISAIADGVEKAHHTKEKCAELSTYALNLDDLVKSEVGEDVAHKPTVRLRRVEFVPSFSEDDIGSLIETETKPKWWRVSRFEQSQEIRQIAGTVRAIGNLVRV